MSPTLAAAGRTPEHDRRLAEHGGALALARVAAVHRGTLELVTDDGPRPGFVTGKLRHAALNALDLPSVGDWVAHDPESGAVHAVLERTSALVRAASDGREPQVLAANVDLVVVVASLTRELNVGRIERMLTLAADAPADARRRPLEGRPRPPTRRRAWPRYAPRSAAPPRCCRSPPSTAAASTPSARCSARA